jgi:hypothetical protein
MSAPLTNYKLPSVLTATIPTVFPTEPGLSTGLQGSMAGDAEYNDSNAAFIASFNRSAPRRAVAGPYPARGGGPGATGAQNRQTQWGGAGQ